MKSTSNVARRLAFAFAAAIVATIPSLPPALATELAPPAATHGQLSTPDIGRPDSGQSIPVDRSQMPSPGNTNTAQDCIDKGQVCTINGTPCCAPNYCKGKFPNTTCQQ